MTLHRIVSAFGGDLYQGGFRANIPAPGHSKHDRSVSLLLVQNRVVIHGFGGSDWQSVKDLLRRQGFIQRNGDLTGGGRGTGPGPRPDPAVRLATAARLWQGGGPLTAGSASERHLRWRAVTRGCEASNLAHHPNAPTAVYASESRTCAALLARISDDNDTLTAIELTYLDPNGRPSIGLRLPRKTVGHVPPGAAVRLAPAAPDMLVGEGVVTALSATERFGLPGWALRSAHNLASWTPPAGVRRVLIAADNGTVGLSAAAQLQTRLRRAGLVATVHAPSRRFGDWNEAAVAAAMGSARDAPGR